MLSMEAHFLQYISDSFYYLKAYGESYKNEDNHEQETTLKYTDKEKTLFFFFLSL